MNKQKDISKQNILKVGVIGSGKMGKHHFQAINLQKTAQLAAMADPLVDSEIEDLLPHGTAIFRSSHDMLRDADIDVVHIVTPPSTHVELTQQALNAGKHVYVEKPFTPRKEEAEHLFSLAKERELHLCAGHQVIFEKPARIALHSLKEIGRLVNIESYFSFRTVRRNITPVDQLLDILPHPVSLLIGFLEQATDSPLETELLHVSAHGEVRAIIAAGEILGSLNVSLQSRPVESYVRLTGTNGSLFADFVRGTVIKLPGPGASAISVIYNTYSQSLQGLWKPTCFFAGMAFKKHKSYPGLAEIIKDFYAGILTKTAFSLTPESTISTVSLCETIAVQLQAHETVLEDQAKENLHAEEKLLPPLLPDSQTILVTGGTGMLGEKVAEELRKKGHKIRILARSIPPYSRRLAGVAYHIADLGKEIPESALTGIEAIIHCAAETLGGKKEHERNTIQATRNIIESAAKNSIKKFIHISSIAVIKTSKEMGGDTLDETTPLDAGNLGRGPYVWGKAEAEKLAISLGGEKDIDVKVIRLGPLVDFTSFQAPGRLGKEAGPFFVAVGPKKSGLSLCDVHTAAKVIRLFINDYNDAPQILNLIEPHAPTRGELVKLVQQKRSDLTCIWLPLWFLKMSSPFLKLLQRMLFPKRKPIDLVAVFSSEPYNSALAAEVVKKIEEEQQTP